MLKGLLAQVLVGALGDYVDGISASEIDLSLMGGTVDLHDLRVKEEALDGMEVPFRVKRGVIGHVRLFVPSYNPYELKKQPLDLHLEDVYLLVGKATQTPEEIERRRQTAEASALTSADLTRTRIAGEELAPKTDEGDTATLVGAIVNNIRISVSRVHLRFEDSTSHANHPFAVGLTFSSFTTENARGAAAVFKSGEAPSLRKAQLKDLAVYWDPMRQLAADADESAMPRAPRNPDHFKAFMKEGVAQGTTLPHHHYTLPPTSPAAMLAKAPAGLAGIPALFASLSLQGVHFQLDRRQFVSATFLQLWLELHQFRPLHRLPYSDSRRRCSAPDGTLAPSSEGRRALRRQWWFYFGQCAMAMASDASAPAAEEGQGEEEAASGSAAAAPEPQAAAAALKPAGGAAAAKPKGPNRFRSYIDAFKGVVVAERAALRKGKSVLEARTAGDEALGKAGKVALLAQETQFSLKQRLFLRWMAEQEVRQEEKKAAAEAAAKQPTQKRSWLAWAGLSSSDAPAPTSATLSPEEMRAMFSVLEPDDAGEASGAGDGRETLRLQLRLQDAEVHLLQHDRSPAAVAHIEGQAALSYAKFKTAFALELTDLFVQDHVAEGSQFPRLLQVARADRAPTLAEEALASQMSEVTHPPSGLLPALQAVGAADPSAPSTPASSLASRAAAMLMLTLHSKAAPGAQPGSTVSKLQKIHLQGRLRPLQAVVAPASLSALATMFAFPASGALRDQLVGRLMALSAPSQSEVWDMLKDRPQLDVDVQLAAPVVQLPTDVREPSAGMLTLHVGKVGITSSGADLEALSRLLPEEAGAEAGAASSFQHMYDCIGFRWEAVHAEVLAPHASQPAPVLSPTSFTSSFGMRAVPASIAPHAPDALVKAEVPAVQVDLSAALLQQLQQLSRHAADLTAELAAAEAAAAEEAAAMTDIPSEAVSSRIAAGAEAAGGDAAGDAQQLTPSADASTQSKAGHTLAIVQASLGHVHLSVSGVSKIINAEAEAVPAEPWMRGAVPDCIALHVGRLSTHAEVNVGSAAVQSKLRSLHVVDTLTGTAEEQAVMLTSTPEWTASKTLDWLAGGAGDEEGVQELISVNATLPLGAKPSQGEVLSQVLAADVRATCLHFLFNPHSLQALAQVLGEVKGVRKAQGSLVESPAPLDSDLLQTPSTVWTEHSDGCTSAEPRAPVFDWATAVQSMQLKLRLDTISVSLWRPETKYTPATISARGLGVSVDSFEAAGGGAPSGRIQGSLSDLEVTEGSPLPSAYPTLLRRQSSAETDVLLSFDITTCSNDADAELAAHDARVSATLHPLQIVYVHEAWMDVVQYATSTMLPTINSLTAAAPISELGTDPVAAFYKGQQGGSHVVRTGPAQRSVLDIQVEAPVIVVPQGRQDAPALVISLESVSVSTAEFRRQALVGAGSGSCVVDKEVLRVSLHEVRLAQTFMPGSPTTGPVPWAALTTSAASATPLGEPMEVVNVQVERPLVEALFPALPTLDVQVDLSAARLALNKPQFDSINLLLKRNLGDTARSASQLLREADFESWEAARLRAQERAGQGRDSLRIRLRADAGICLELRDDRAGFARVELPSLKLGMLSLPARFAGEAAADFGDGALTCMAVTLGELQLVDPSLPADGAFQRVAALQGSASRQPAHSIQALAEESILGDEDPIHITLQQGSCGMQLGVQVADVAVALLPAFLSKLAAFVAPPDTGASSPGEDQKPATDTFMRVNVDLGAANAILPSWAVRPEMDTDTLSRVLQDTWDMHIATQGSLQLRAEGSKTDLSVMLDPTGAWCVPRHASHYIMKHTQETDGASTAPIEVLHPTRLAVQLSMVAGSATGPAQHSLDLDLGRLHLTASPIVAHVLRLSSVFVLNSSTSESPADAKESVADEVSWSIKAKWPGAQLDAVAWEPSDGEDFAATAELPQVAQAAILPSSCRPGTKAFPVGQVLLAPDQSGEAAEGHCLSLKYNTGTGAVEFATGVRLDVKAALASGAIESVLLEPWHFEADVSSTLSDGEAHTTAQLKALNALKVQVDNQHATQAGRASVLWGAFSEHWNGKLPAAAAKGAATTPAEEGEASTMRGSTSATFHMPGIEAKLLSRFLVNEYEVSTLSSPVAIASVAVPEVSANMQVSASGTEFSLEAGGVQVQGQGAGAGGEDVLFSSVPSTVHDWMGAWLPAPALGSAHGVSAKYSAPAQGPARTSVQLPAAVVNWSPVLVDNVRFFVVQALKQGLEASLGPGTAQGGTSEHLALDDAEQVVHAVHAGESSSSNPILRLAELPEQLRSFQAKQPKQGAPATDTSSMPGLSEADVKERILSAMHNAYELLGGASDLLSVSLPALQVAMLRAGVDTESAAADESQRFPACEAVLRINGTDVSVGTAADGRGIMHARVSEVSLWDTSGVFHAGATPLLHSDAVHSDGDVIRICTESFPQSHPEFVSASSRVWIAVAPMPIVFTQGAFMRVLQYATEGVLPALSLDLALEVDDSSAASLKSAVFSRTLLNIHVASPRLLLPLHPDRIGGEVPVENHPHLSVTLGGIVVRNSLAAMNASRATSDCLVDTMHVSVSGLSLKQSTGQQILQLPQLDLSMDRMAGSLSPELDAHGACASTDTLPSILSALPQFEGDWGTGFDVQLAAALPQAVAVHVTPGAVANLLLLATNNLGNSGAAQASSRQEVALAQGGTLVPHPHSGALPGSTRISFSAAGLSLSLARDTPDSLCSQVEVKQLLLQLCTAAVEAAGPTPRLSLLSLRSSIRTVEVGSAAVAGGVLHKVLYGSSSKADAAHQAMLAADLDVVSGLSAGSGKYVSLSSSLQDLAVVAAMRCWANALNVVVDGMGGQSVTQSLPRFISVAPSQAEPVHTTAAVALSAALLVPFKQVDEGEDVSWTASQRDNLSLQVDASATADIALHLRGMSMRTFPLLNTMRSASVGQQAAVARANAAGLPVPSLLPDFVILQHRQSTVQSDGVQVSAFMQRVGGTAVPLLHPTRFRAEVGADSWLFAPAQHRLEAQRVYGPPPSTIVRRRREAGAQARGLRQHEWKRWAQGLTRSSDVAASEAAVSSAAAMTSWLSASRLPSARTTFTLAAQEGSAVVQIGFRDIVSLTDAAGSLSESKAAFQRGAAEAGAEVQASPTDADSPGPESPGQLAIPPEMAFGSVPAHIDDYSLHVQHDAFDELRVRAVPHLAEVGVLEHASSRTAPRDGLLGLMGLVAESDYVVAVDEAAPAFDMAPPDAAVHTIHLRSQPMTGHVSFGQGLRLLLVNDVGGGNGFLMGVTLPVLSADVHGNLATLPASASGTALSLLDTDSLLLGQPVGAGFAAGTVGFAVPPGSLLPAPQIRPGLLSIFCSADLEVAVDVFNAASGAWEPFLQCLGLHAQFSALDLFVPGGTAGEDHLGRRAPLRQAFLESRQPGDVGITRGFVPVGFGPGSGRLEITASFSTFERCLGVMHAWEAAQAQRAQQGAASGPGGGSTALRFASQFVIRNDCGAAVKFVPSHLQDALVAEIADPDAAWDRAAGRGGGGFDAAAGILLLPGQEAPLSFPVPEGMLDARRALSSHDASRESPKHVQVWVQGCALPLQPADVQRAGVLRNSMRLPASQSGESAAAVPLSTQVKVVDGTTVLTVRSRVAVHNHTHLECEVLVPGRAVGDDPVLVGTVQAHAAYALPPEHSTASVLHLRPVRYRTDDDEELPLRHTAFDSISLRTNQEHEVLARCQGGDGANALPYNLVLWSRLYTRLDGAYKVLSLRPPAEVTNGLPRSVAVQVVQGGHPVALPLEPGASCPVYAASCLMDTAMSVELEGYAPSALPSLKAFISEAKSDGGKSMSETRLRLAQQLADGRSSSTRDGALYCSVEYSAHFAVQAAGQKASNRTSLPRVSVVLFASHWLVDNSGFGLSYGLAGATGKVKAAETGQVVEELFEQQRCFNFFSGKYETQHWLAPHGQPSSKAEVEARLPAGWSWTGPWVVHVGEGLGPEGFDYAFDYPEFKRAGRTPQGKKGANSWVRQRKWLRTRVKTAPAAPATPGVDDLGTASSDPDAVTMVHLTDKYSALQVRHGTGTWCTGTDLTSLMGAANLVVPVDSGMLAQLSSPGQTRRGRSGTLQPASAGQSTASLSAEGQLPHALNLVSWQRPAAAPFHRSKVVTISPALWIVNACPSHLKWCYTPIKRRSKPERIFDVNPGEAVPMHMDISDRLASDCLPYISVCPDIAMGSWSCPFPVGMQEELPITVPIVDAGSTRNPAGVLPAGHIVLGASCKPHDTIPNSYVLVITQCTQFPQCAAPNSTAQARPTSTVPPLSQEEADAALKEGVPAVVPATMTIRNTTDAVLLYKQVGAVRVSDEGRRVPAAYFAALPGEVAAVGWEQLHSEATREFGMRFVSAEAWDAAGAQSPCAELPPRALSAEMQVAPDRLGQRAVVTVPGATRSSPAQRLAVSVKVAARTVELLAHDADETALAAGSGAATGSGAAASVDSAASGSQDVLENAYERDGASLLGQAAFAHAVMHGQWGALAADQMWDDVHSLSLAGLGLSLVDYRPSETLYLSMDHVQLLSSKDRTAYRLSLKVLHLQLDDMAADSSYPSVVTSLTAASAAIREHAQCQSLGRDTSPTPQALAETMATALKAGLSRAALELSVVRVRHPRKMLLKGVALQIAPLRVAASYALILSSLLQGVVVQHSVQSAAMAAELQAKLRGGADRVVADSVARAVPAATLGDAAGTGGTGAVPLRRTLELLFPSSSHLDSIRDSTRAWMLGGDVDMLQDGTSEPPGALTSAGATLSHLEVAEALATAPILAAVSALSTRRGTDPAAVLAGLHAASAAAGGTQPMAALGVRLDHLLSGGSEGSVLSAVLAGRMPLFIERLSILPVQLLLSYKYAGLGEGMSAPQEAVQSVDAAFHHTVGRYLRTSLTLNDAPVGVPAFQENHTLRTLGATLGRWVEFARGHSMSPAALAGIITSSNAFGRTGEYFRRATSNLASGDARLSHTLRLLSLGADVAGGTLDVVSRGIASATGDTASLAATEADRQRFEQENTGVGVVKDLGMGIFRGVAGVFTKPAEGAASGGVAGFAKGLGQGVLGLAASPLMGISTATRRIASGVNRGVATDAEKMTIFAPLVRRRARHAPLGPQRLLRPYNAQQALMVQVALGMHAKAGTGDLLVDCAELSIERDGSSTLLLVTTLGIGLVKLQRQETGAAHRMLQTLAGPAFPGDVLTFQRWEPGAQAFEWDVAQPSKLILHSHGRAVALQIGDAGLAESLLPRVQAAQLQSAAFVSTVQLATGTGEAV